MAKEDKYFYVTSSNTRHQPELIKWNEDLTLAVGEDVDWLQDLDLTILKLGAKDIHKPKSNKYTKYKPVIKEVFLDHYKLAVKYIHEVVLDEGEFYLFKHSKDWYEVLYYSNNEKDKLRIVIDFRDSIENLWLQLRCIKEHKGRPAARKHGVAIESERFKQFLNLTIQYFYDPDSLTVYLEDYLKNFKMLVEGDTKIEGFIISGEKTVENILMQLEARKEYLEKRLIENDSDSVNDRIKFRGELEGIEYAVKVVKSN